VPLDSAVFIKRQLSKIIGRAASRFGRQKAAPPATHPWWDMPHLYSKPWKLGFQPNLGTPCELSCAARPTLTALLANQLSNCSRAIIGRAASRFGRQKAALPATHPWWDMTRPDSKRRKLGFRSLSGPIRAPCLVLRRRRTWALSRLQF
jgi:hypothetical protein